LKSSNYNSRRLNLNNNSQKYRVNLDIHIPEVRLIGTDGSQLGIKSRNDALRMAELKNLDLVEIAPYAKPPVCKITDYGKFLYEIQKKDKTQKKTQTQQLLKEIRFKWRTDTHDFNFKVKHARGFIEEGNKVKATVIFRGREITHNEIGKDLLDKFIEEMKDIAKVDQDFRMDGKNMSVVLSPLKPVKKPTTKSKVSTPKDAPKSSAPTVENKDILAKD
jgi:translation initiation factor IF-3